MEFKLTAKLTNPSSFSILFAVSDSNPNIHKEIIMQELIPLNYRIHLDPDLTRFKFDGKCDILLDAPADRLRSDLEYS